MNIRYFKTNRWHSSLGLNLILVQIVESNLNLNFQRKKAVNHTYQMSHVLPSNLSLYKHWNLSWYCAYSLALNVLQILS